MEKPWRITVHHGGEEQPDAPVSKRAAIDRMRSYQSAHFQRGWADIGYHFVIDGAGRIWEGRLTRWQGAHAGNADLNRGNIGICLMGNYEERQPSAEQVSALRSLLTWLTTE
ncbi:MAG: peptidoglycan recognition family protein [Planctomycetota bacterium]